MLGKIMSDDKKKEEYFFGGLEEYSLEEIQTEVLNDSTYLDVFAGSDLRIKENVEGMGSVLSKVTSLDCIKYNYKQDYEASDLTSQYGLVAQEVAQFFPELVVKDLKGQLKLNYTGMIPVLVKSLKELYQQVEDQQQEIKKLKSI